MKLNLDSLKKDLMGRKPADAAAPSSEPSQKPESSSLTENKPNVVRDVPTKSGVLKLVSLTSSSTHTPQDSTIKLVSLEELKKKKEQQTLEEKSEPVAVQGEMSLDQKILQEEEPVFKNLNKETHIAWEAQKMAYEKYKRARRKKIAQYTAYPLAAVFVLSFISSYFAPAPSPFSYQVSVSQKSQNVNSMHSSANMNMSGTGSMVTYVTGNEYVAMVETKVQGIKPDVKVNMEHIFQGLPTVLTLEAVRWWLYANEIPILQPTDPTASPDSYIVKYAQNHNIVQNEAEIREHLKQSQLELFTLPPRELTPEEQVAQVLENHRKDQQKIGIANTTMNTYLNTLPGEAAKKNNANMNENNNQSLSVLQADFLTPMNENKNGITIPQGVNITDPVAGVTLVDVITKRFSIAPLEKQMLEAFCTDKPTITVAEGLQQTMQALHIPILIPRTNVIPPYITSFAVRKGIVKNTEQLQDNLTYEMLIKMIYVFQRRVH
jgi:hypothetical protein